MDSYSHKIHGRSRLTTANIFKAMERPLKFRNIDIRKFEVKLQQASIYISAA